MEQVRWDMSAQTSWICCLEPTIIAVERSIRYHAQRRHSLRHEPMEGGSKCLTNPVPKERGERPTQRPQDRLPTPILHQLQRRPQGLQDWVRDAVHHQLAEKLARSRMLMLGASAIVVTAIVAIGGYVGNLVLDIQVQQMSEQVQTQVSEQVQTQVSEQVQQMSEQVQQVSEQLEIKSGPIIQNAEFLPRTTILEIQLQQMDEKGSVNPEKLERAIDEFESLYSDFVAPGAASDDESGDGTIDRKTAQNRERQLANSFGLLAQILLKLDKRQGLERLVDLAPNLARDSTSVFQARLQFYGRDLIGAPDAPASWSEGKSHHQTYQSYQDQSKVAQEKGYPEIHFLFEAIIWQMEGKDKNAIKQLLDAIDSLNDEAGEYYEALLEQLASGVFVRQPTAESQRIADRAKAFIAEYQNESTRVERVAEALDKDATLAGANLVRANLEGKNLEGADLTGANLVRANLEGANLTRAILEGANLTRANLRPRGPRSARTSATCGPPQVPPPRGPQQRGPPRRKPPPREPRHKADLSNAKLAGASLHHANLVRADLSNAKLAGAKPPPRGPQQRVPPRRGPPQRVPPQRDWPDAGDARTEPGPHPRRRVCRRACSWPFEEGQGRSVAPEVAAVGSRSSKSSSKGSSRRRRYRALQTAPKTSRKRAPSCLLFSGYRPGSRWAGRAGAHRRRRAPGRAGARPEISSSRTRRFLPPPCAVYRASTSQVAAQRKSSRISESVVDRQQEAALDPFQQGRQAGEVLPREAPASQGGLVSPIGRIGMEEGSGAMRTRGMKAAQSSCSIDGRLAGVRGRRGSASPCGAMDRGGHLARRGEMGGLAGASQPSSPR